MFLLSSAVGTTTQVRIEMTSETGKSEAVITEAAAAACSTSLFEPLPFWFCRTPGRFGAFPGTLNGLNGICGLFLDGVDSFAFRPTPVPTLDLPFEIPLSMVQKPVTMHVPEYLVAPLLCIFQGTATTVLPLPDHDLCPRPLHSDTDTESE